MVIKSNTVFFENFFEILDIFISNLSNDICAVSTISGLLDNNNFSRVDLDLGVPKLPKAKAASWITNGFSSFSMAVMSMLEH